MRKLWKMANVILKMIYLVEILGIGFFTVEELIKRTKTKIESHEKEIYRDGYQKGWDAAIPYMNDTAYSIFKRSDR